MYVLYCLSFKAERLACVMNVSACVCSFVWKTVNKIKSERM